MSLESDPFVEVSFNFVSPLYCTPAKNVAAIKLQEKEIAENEGRYLDEIIPVDCETSRELIYWRLEPTNETPNFYGYWPRMMGCWCKGKGSRSCCGSWRFEQTSRKMASRIEHVEHD